VEKLARGADLLVSEMIDVEGTVAEIRRTSPGMPPAAFSGIETHLRDHHLTPMQVSELARAAGVRAVVVIHLAAPYPDGAGTVEYLRQIARSYTGPVVIARDLDEF
jgi:ribonuclease BN (tRNA processing enzyme)